MFSKRKRRQSDFDEEIHSHLEFEAERLETEGMSPEEARAAARRAFGNITKAQERFYECRRILWLDHLWQDVRFALRNLRKNPGLTLAALVTLALGIGANTAIFTAVDAVLLRPLPVRNLGRVVVLRDDVPGLNLRNIDISAVQFEELARRSDLFESTGATSNANFNLTSGVETTRVAGLQTMGEFFRVFEVRPTLGRLYEPGEEATGRHLVAVLSYGFWQRMYGGDRHVLGRRVELNGEPYEIVGVLPASFRYPPAVEIYAPLPVHVPYRRQGANFLVAYATLREGVSLPKLHAPLQSNAKGFADRLGIKPELGFTQIAVPFVEFAAGQLRAILLVLMGAVGLVLLIACANVSGLELARAIGRSKEFAVRTALGASRWRLVRLTLVESTLLACAGAALGLLLAVLTLDAFSSWKGREYPALNALSPSLALLAFTAAVAVVSGLTSGLFPAARASQVDLQDGLREAGRGLSAGVSRSRLLHGFAVVQIALALVLLIASVLLVQSFRKLWSVDPGFRPDGLLTMQLDLPQARYRQSESLLAFFRSLESRLEAIPGLRAVGVTSALPFTRFVNSSNVLLLDRPAPPGGPQPHANMRQVDNGFFAAMGTPLVKGRLFSDSDTPKSTLVAVIDAQFARQYYPSEDPIGKRISQGREALIVGVVGSVLHQGLDAPPKPTVYYSGRQTPTSRLFVVARTDREQPAVVSLIRSAVSEVDRYLAVHNIEWMTTRIERSVGTRRLAMLLMSGFAVVALLLALVGTYGVLSYSIHQRTHEIGVRLALGARPGDVVAMVLRKGARLALTGIGLGVLAALGMTRLLASLLYGVSPRDALSIAGCATLLAVMILLACLVPARRVARLQASTALRRE